jgi:outer membrane murein-binding lipoprotein Lpp
MFLQLLAVLLVIYTLYVAFNKEHFVDEQASSLTTLEKKVEKLEKEFNELKHTADVQSNQAEAAVMALQGIN